MTDEPPQNLEMVVLRRIIGAFKSPEVWNAERPEGAPYVDEDRALALSLSALVQRQGHFLALLSVNPFTRAELRATMPGMADRAPAWLEASFRGEEMTWTIFLRGLAQTLQEHRVAIERVVSEQVRDTEEIEAALSDAPVPSGHESQERDQTMQGVFDALAAHMKALADIAHDLEVNHGVSIDFEDP